MKIRTLKVASLSFALALILAPISFADENDPPLRPSEAPLIEMVICLDTSGSMEGLIDAARQKIWAIVNDLATSRPTPRFRVALLSFGNLGNSAEDGWVRVETDFTEDLDLVSQKLFALTTNGGDEYVGRVLARSLDRLNWNAKSIESMKSPAGHSGMRLIFVAGNESAEQDPQVDFRVICKDAISRDIMVNSIYCGPATDELAPAWREVARLADGHFASIDKDNGTVVIATPFDNDMATLSTKLNDTYIPVGSDAEAKKENQSLQDDNALGLNSEAAAGRAMAKCQTQYVCSWDLIDGLAAGDIDLEKLDRATLPEALRDKTVEELRAYVEDQRARRSEVQEQIKVLAAKRDAHIAEEMQKQNLDDTNSFDRAVRDAIRAQAKSHGFTFAEN